MEMDKQIQQQENPHETSITVREIQMKIIMSVHFLPIRMAMRQTLMGTWRSCKVVPPCIECTRVQQLWKKSGNADAHTAQGSSPANARNPTHCKQQEELTLAAHH